MMRERTAFTLVEMILVVTIIALLAALVLNNYAGITVDAKIKAAGAQIKSLKVAVNRFEIACGRFPTTTEGLRALIERPADLAESAEWRQFLEEPQVPRDPWGQEYMYRYPSLTNPKGFDIFSRGPDGQEGNEDDIPKPPAP